MNLRSRLSGYFLGLVFGSVTSLGADSFPAKVPDSALAGDDEPPVVLAVAVPANGSYRAGAVLSFTADLSEIVMVDLTGGTPCLALKVGGDTVFASYASGTGTNALVFNYTVQAGNNDSDGIALPGILSPNGGTLRDAAGNDLAVALNGAASTTGVIVDTIGPVVTDFIRLDPNPTTATSVRYGITFSEPVTGLDSSDFSVHLSGVGSSGGAVWVSKITPTSATSFDLVVSGFTGTISLKLIVWGYPYAKIYDVAGNQITALMSCPYYNITDITPPVVNSVAVPGRKTYVAGQNLDFTVTCNEKIAANTLGGTPRIPITFDMGGTAFAYLNSGTGTTALKFRITVAAGQLDTTGITVGNTIDLNGGTLRDGVGNDLTPALKGIAATSGVLVDAVAPISTALNRADPSPTRATSVGYTLNFSEAVKGVDAGDLSIVTSGSAAGHIAGFTAVDAFSYTVIIDGITGDGTLGLDLNSSDTGITDMAGNPITAGLSGQVYTIDQVPPIVTHVGVPASLTYQTGQNLDFAVKFSEAVTVDSMGGMPRIAIFMEAGGTAFADYLSGSGTNSLVFRMVVVSGQVDINGVTLAAAIDLAGATIRDSLLNDANLTLNSMDDTTGVLVDAVSPTVVGDGIPNQTLIPGGAVKILSLQSFFTDVGSTSLIYSMTANSASSRASAVISGSNLTLKPLANGITHITIRADDGHGGIVSDTFEVAVGTAKPKALQIGATGRLNKQNGLFELTVMVTNTTARPINGFRLIVDYSAYEVTYPGLRLFNATGSKNKPKAYIDYPFPVASNEKVPMELRFYSRTRNLPSIFKPNMKVKELTVDQVASPRGKSIPVWSVQMPNKDIQIEFSSVVGKWYRVRYSEDKIHWRDCLVPIRASTNRTQWIDSGPPFTDVPPSQVTSRNYRVDEISAH